MDRDFYLTLAATGLCMPMAGHLVLHEQAQADEVVHDGRRLGHLLIDTARRYATPLVLSLMDLTVDKAELVSLLGIESAQADGFHLSEALDPPTVAAIAQAPLAAKTTRFAASLDALRVVGEQRDRVPVGVAIGPFSLATKLVVDPITAVYLAASGSAASEDPEVAAFVCAMTLAEHTVARSVRAQVRAGARAMLICEPAANSTYISPLQAQGPPDAFERFVIEPNRRLRRLLAGLEVDLLLHDCGEMTDAMLRRLAALDPAILSLGSSRDLPRDAQFVGGKTVLYGNLPSRQFYSDQAMPLERVRAMAQDLTRRMRATGHPFILGSECDVLSVPGAHAAITAKVDAMMAAAPAAQACET